MDLHRVGAFPVQQNPAEQSPAQLRRHRFVQSDIILFFYREPRMSHSLDEIAIVG